jgi:hypothetical protein
MQTLCIPRVEIAVKHEYILHNFKQLKIGTIISCKEIPLRNDPNYKRIIISIMMNNNEQTQRITKLLNDNKPVKVVHEMPWYWKVFKYQPQKAN